MSATASAMAAMCSGVVPQQPPTILNKPSLAYWAMISAINSGEWSYSPNALGSPALAYKLTYSVQTGASSSK